MQKEYESFIHGYRQQKLSGTVESNDEMSPLWQSNDLEEFQGRRAAG